MKAKTEKAHADLGASNADRWMNCPGSVELIKKAPPQRESEYAKEGTDAHKCLEIFLKNPNKKLQTAAMLAKKYPFEMVSHAEKAFEEIIRRLVPDSVLLTETKVDASPFTVPGQFGTLDAAVVEEFGRLTVIDFKYGAGIPVDVEENRQLLYYALGVAHAYHYNFEDVSLMVIQPRADHHAGPVREWITSIHDLVAWGEKFRDAAKRTQAPDAPHVPGKWCQFCSAAPICPALREQSLAQARIDFSDDKGLVVPPPTLTAIPDLPKYLNACDRLETWIASVRAHALHVLERGEKIEGWKLVEKRSIRKWTDEDAASKTARKIFGDAAFTSPELLSPAQLEKAVEDKVLVEKFIGANASNKSSGVTLAPESDKRPAVNQIEVDFKDDPKVEVKPQLKTISKNKG